MLWLRGRRDVVVVIVMHLKLVGDEIIVRVAVIRDQSTTMVVASDFNLGGVDLVVIYNIGVSVDLDHRLSGGDCGGSELGVGAICGLNVATSLVELNSMSALRLLVVWVFMVVMVIVVLWLRGRRDVVLIIVMHLWLVRDEVIVGVAVIRDQSTTVVVASDFDLVGVDLVVIDNVGVSVDLDHRLSGGDCGGSELGVGVRGSVDITTCGVKFNTMGACRLFIVTMCVIVVFVVVVCVVVIISVRVGFVVLVVIMMGVLILAEVMVSIPV